jgi:hypothetical protein
VKAEPEVSLFFGSWYVCMCVCFIYISCIAWHSVERTLTIVWPVRRIFLPVNRLKRNVISRAL